MTILIEEVFKMNRYEELIIEIIKLSHDDVISTSAFDGEDDEIDGW